MDQTFGLLLGTVNGAVLLYALVALAVYLADPLEKVFGPPPPAVRTSLVVALVRRHAAVDAMPATMRANLEKLVAATKDPLKSGALADQPELKKLLDDPEMKAALENQSVTQALRSGDLSVLKNYPRLQTLLKNPGISSTADPR